MATATGPGGLDLSAIASQAANETGLRLNGGQAFLESALAAMLAENQGRLLSQSEQQIREQNFARAQQLLDDALARRAAASGGGGGGGSRRDPGLDLQMDMMMEQFKNDQDIAKQERLLELQDKFTRRQAAREAQASQYRLSDYAPGSIDPTKGRLLAESGGKVSRGKWGRRLAASGTSGYDYVSKDDIDAVRRIVGNVGTNPLELDTRLRDHFKKKYGSGTLASNAASYALYRVGYGEGLMGAGSGG